MRYVGGTGGSWRQRPFPHSTNRITSRWWEGDEDWDFFVVGVNDSLCASFRYNTLVTTSLLHTKLNMPPLRPLLVHRQRLFEKLELGLARKLTLVTAPAGYGKTTLVAEWLAQDVVAKHCWLSLSENDNDPTQFWTYIVATLQTIVPDFGLNILTVLRDSPAANAVPLTELINEMMACDGLQRGFVLVLDDYHVINNRFIHEAITFLLTHMPSPMRLVITSRVDPPLPLARFRVRDQIVEIREADLRFLEAETAVFLNQIMRLNLSHEDVAALEARTEGWIASLQLAALAMQSPANQFQNRHDFVTSFTGSDRYIVDYLVEEVLHQQPPHIQDFLLQTAVLHQLSAPLCEAILKTGSLTFDRQPQKILEYLDSSNLFLIPLDNQRQRYRYHHLFGDLLRYRLQEVYPERVAKLHGRASQWCEKNGLIEEAIAHALSADDFKREAQLVERYAHNLFSEGKMMTLVNWLDLLPEETIYSRPGLYLLQAWILLRTGQIEAGEKHLQRPLPATDELVNDVVRGEIACLQAYVAYFRGDFDDSIRLSLQARQLLPPENLALWMPVTTVLAWGYAEKGKLPLTIELHQKVVQCGLQADSLTGTVGSLGSLTYLYAAQGNIRQAEAAFDRAAQFAKEKGASHLPLLGIAYIGKGQIYHIQEDWVAAQQHLRSGIALCEQWGGLIIYTVRAYLSLVHALEKSGATQEAKAISMKLLQMEHLPDVPSWIKDEIQQKLSQRTQLPRPSPEPQRETLTRREYEILRLLAEGLTSPEVAEKLVIGVSTVRTHIKRIYAKLDAHSRHEAIARAREFGLLNS